MTDPVSPEILTELDPRGALDAAIDAARLADPVILHGDGRSHAYVPKGYELKEITDPERLPRAIRQKVTVDERASLVAYANRFSDARSMLVADYDKGQIVAYLDWHHGSDGELVPQPNRHAATLQLRDSEEYARWSQMEGKLHSQDEFAHFIEENVSDVIDPDHSALLEICRDLEATQGVSFRSGVRLDNGDRTFVYENETRTKGELQVPTEIRLSIPLYQGEGPSDVKAKFRFRVGPGGLQLGFQWHRVEYIRQATFRAMATQAAEETGLPLIYGRRDGA